jgi:hypothetical protein
MGLAENLSHKDRWCLLERWAPPRLKMRLRCAALVLVVAAVVVNVIAKTATVWTRARATMVAIDNATVRTTPWRLLQPF